MPITHISVRNFKWKGQISNKNQLKKELRYQASGTLGSKNSNDAISLPYGSAGFCVLASFPPITDMKLYVAEVKWMSVAPDSLIPRLGIPGQKKLFSPTIYVYILKF